MAKRTNTNSNRKTIKPARTGVRKKTSAKSASGVRKKTSAKPASGVRKKTSAKSASGVRKKTQAAASKNLKKVKPPHFDKHKTSGRPKRRFTRYSGPAKSTAPEGMVRLQKYLSEVGLASRRGAEEMVLEGRIAVNGKAVESLPCFIDPTKDDVFVDGRRIRRRNREKVYLLASKPKGVLCTSSDPEGRKCLIDMLGDLPARVYCVGRLDIDSTGIILLTNDGALTQHLTHPSHEVPKTYSVTVEGRVDYNDLEKLRSGVYLDGQRTRGVKETKILRRSLTSTALEMTLTEGRNREIRRVLLRLGHKVRRLKRIAIGPITDRGLKIGHVRPLTDREVDWLRKTGR